MSPILVTFAVPQESRDFRRALAATGRQDVRVEHIGVGPEMAAKRIGRLLTEERPALVICAGFAGGLDAGLATGDLVIAENFSAAEPLDRARKLRGHLLAPAFGAVVSRPLPVETIPAKAALGRETGALAVDMESETVATACRAAAVPLLVVRAISDPADEALPVPFDRWFDLVGQKPRVLALLGYLASHPGQIGAFARFVRGLAPARLGLAGFLGEFLSSPTLSS